MEDLLNEARSLLGTNAKLSGLVIRKEGDEFHLFRGDDHFARLRPTEKEGIWCMEYFRNRERWECLDFRGSLKECLAFLSENDHYLFWEG